MPAIKRCQGLYLDIIVDLRLEVGNAKGLKFIASTDLLKMWSKCHSLDELGMIYTLCE
jgi:hypothetical protein